MICIFPNCKNNNIVARYLCQKHFDKIKYQKNLKNYPLMQREAGSGTFHNGYKKLTIQGRRILEHRYIVEKARNKNLTPIEKIHHLDGNKLNNSLDNLIITSQTYHITKFHNNKPRVFDWNKFKPFNSHNRCQVCNEPTKKISGLCRKHYDTYWHWRQRH